MFRSAAALSLVLAIAVGAAFSAAKAADPDTLAAINAASNALDEAFAKKDAATIKALMTPDHLTVTPYYDGPQTVDDQLASLDEYDWSQTIVGEPDVAMLAPDVALRTFTAELKGTFQGKTLPSRVFATELLVKRDGKWVERFYQVTTLEP
jgi:ketosteroid isomerase-like protein